MGNKGSKPDLLGTTQIVHFLIVLSSGVLGMLEMEECSAKTSPCTDVVELEVLDKLRSLKDQFNPRLDLKPAEILELCRRTRAALLAEPSLLRLQGPMVIAGDIHGQFKDLRKIFARFGYPTSNGSGLKYLFLGDYVDRGQQGLEVCLMLFALKCAYPSQVFLLRGNHECARVNREYGFHDECKRRLSLSSYFQIYEAVNGVFNALPIAAVVDKRIFCVHVGLSPHLHSLEQVEAIKRPGEMPDSGLIYDLLWSDPLEDDDEINGALDADGWAEGGTRGRSKVFSSHAIHSFLSSTHLSLICRSHGFAQEGYRFYAQQGLLTIFSAPNYCQMGNRGAVLVVDETADAKIHLFT